MLLAVGDKLGPCEILSAIGAGGMGEVYRARDTNLGRDVAIKVLPEAFARDPERMARFQREAKVLASLDHPNIASIYGVEDSGATLALVMQLAEGPTLADRIKQGPLPIDEALRIARQMADALEYAHERGVVHRDLKPANVKVSRDDSVKILDFGLAKAVQGEAGDLDMANSPTLTHMATQAGVLLGTAAYMSPEQAKAKPVDRRADIWAFGCVLYEMLTGKMAFASETVADTLAAVLTKEPDWALLPAATPARVRALLRRCLQKDAKQRLQAIGEVRITLDEVLSRAPDASGGLEGSTSGIAAALMPASMRRRALPWGIAALLAIIAAGVGTWAWLAPRQTTEPPALAYIPPPPGTSFRSFGFGEGPVVVSPDGKELAFSAADQKGITQIWVRRLADGTTTALAGTDDGAMPFWSADGLSLGFFADNKLKTVTIGSETVQTLGDANCDDGGAWNSQNVILFVPRCGGPIDRISASGGIPQPVIQLATGEIVISQPAFLPGGTAFFYISEDKNRSISIRMASLTSGKSEPVLSNAESPQFASGYLLFLRSGKIFAEPFDPESGKLSGNPLPLGEAQSFSASGNGVLTWQGGTADARLEWFDRNGNSLGTIGDVRPWVTTDISPDGKEVLADDATPGSGGTDLWLYPAKGGVGTRLTFGPGPKIWAVWSPDGKYIAYACHPGATWAICRKPADGSGAEETLMNFGPDTLSAELVDWSPDGRYLSCDIDSAKTGRQNDWILALDGSKRLFEPAPVDAAQFDGNFSPGGHWLAYFSYETGRPEVFVVPFPATGAKYQISQTGGWALRWAAGNKLSYLTMGNRLMEADLAMSGDSLTVKSIEPLFQLSLPTTNAPLFDVSRDGSRFIVATSADPAASDSITLLLNWPERLKEGQ